MTRRPFTAEHEMLRKSVRSFVEREVTPQVAAWEDARSEEVVLAPAR